MRRLLCGCRRGGREGGLRVGYVYLMYLFMGSGWGYGTRMIVTFEYANIGYRKVKTIRQTDAVPSNRKIPPAIQRGPRVYSPLCFHSNSTTMVCHQLLFRRCKCRISHTLSAHRTETFGRILLNPGEEAMLLIFSIILESSWEFIY